MAFICFKADADARDLGYHISHCGYITVKTEDPDGNVFTVRNDGSNSVTLSDQYQEKVKNSGNHTVYSKVRKRHLLANIGRDSRDVKINSSGRGSKYLSKLTSKISEFENISL